MKFARVSFITSHVCMVLATVLTCWPTFAKEAEWIWSPEHPRNQAGQGDCYFRKEILLSSIQEANVTITADDSYELFVNGRRAGSGQSIRQMDNIDIAPFLRRGKNIVAVRVTNLATGPAALVARVQVKPLSGDWQSFSTDSSWRTALEVVPMWQSAMYNDSRWKAAQSFGPLGETAPWDRREEVAREDTSENQRFRVNPEFSVQQVLDHEQIGSVIAMAFNEFGHIIASRENQPLVLIYDSDKDGVVDKVRNYCDLIKNVQGILPLNGDVYVTGEGPEGSGVYRLFDKDRNGSLEEYKLILAVKGSAGEHGIHGLTLGPEGMIYCILGNHVQYSGKFAESSPVKTTYEGDLVGPRYEDPGGHAAGIKAPGGTVIRTDVEGKRVELVASGLRNAYDLAFHPNGGLFVHDSDMESDVGTVWYRPTSLYEIGEGSEFGWRSGWAAWPSYFFDRLPTLLETGRGSPTGAVVYDHFSFPHRYHGNLFLADWSEGRILNVTLKNNGAGHQAHAEVFLQGQPLNVTDLAVGPEGHLYFSTGGRGTNGGIYRVQWRGVIPQSVRELGQGIARAIRQPQIESAWGRQEIATLKKQMGADWNDSLIGVAYSEENPSKYRLRALELMQLFGPQASDELLLELSASPNEQVRTRATQQLWMHQGSPAVIERLLELVSDSDRRVQRAACESLARIGKTPDLDKLEKLLGSDDRYLAWSARLLLERVPVAQWRDKMLSSDDQRLLAQAGLALMRVDPNAQHAQQVLTNVNRVLQGFVSDRNLIDVLRLTQVVLHRSGLKAGDVGKLREKLIEEYPIGEPILNRELFRLLAFLNAEETIDQALSFLQSDAELSERVHVGMHLRFFDHKWKQAERFALVKFYEESQKADGGSSYPLYIMHAARDVCADLPIDEAKIFVSEGAKWPNAALVSLYRFPDKLEESDLRTLRLLDQQIEGDGFEGDQYKRLRTGIVALLAGSSDAQSMQYLRDAWIRSPERRQAIALGLAQNPSDENWDYLVRSLPVLESYAIPEILNCLSKVDIAADDPDALREVILHGLRMEQAGQDPVSAIVLLKHWTGWEPAKSTTVQKSKMAAWQTWYKETYPDRLEAVLPSTPDGSRWNIETLTEYFNSTEGKSGNVEKGQMAFQKGDCAKCHRFADKGATVGPDLTSLAKRFSRKETLEAILFPSHVISDQYATKRVLTADGRIISGIAVTGADGSLTIRDSELKHHTIAEQDIAQVQPSKVSVMPSGLLDRLTIEEIRDLFAYMGYVSTQQVAQRPSSASQNR